MRSENLLTDGGRSMKKILKPEFFAVLLFIASFVWLFLLRPVVSVADNGDFARLMYAVGLDKFPDSFDNSYFHYAQIKFMTYPCIFGENAYITTHALTAFAAKYLCGLFSPQVFDVRFLAGLYMVFLLAGVFYIIRSMKTGKWYVDFLLTAAFALVFCDPSYFAYVNSLFGEGSAFAFLFLILGITLKISCSEREPSRLDLFLLFAALTLFFGSKMQYTLLFPLSLLILLPLWKYKALPRRPLIVGMSVMLVLNVGIYAVQPRDLPMDTIYNSVFFGLLKNAPDVHEAAQEIGVEEKYESLAGTNAYTEGTPRTLETPEFMDKFYKNTTRGKIILYYLRHVDQLWKGMEITADRSFDNQQGMYGNYLLSEGFAPSAHETGITWYNQLKTAVYPKSFLFLVLYYLIYFGSILWLLVKKRPKNPMRLWLMLFVLILGVLQYPLPYLGNGEADIAKQLYVFNMTFDFSLLGAVWTGLRKLLSFRECNHLNAK